MAAELSVNAENPQDKGKQTQVAEEIRRFFDEDLNWDKGVPYSTHAVTSEEMKITIKEVLFDRIEKKFGNGTGFSGDENPFASGKDTLENLYSQDLARVGGFNRYMVNRGGDRTQRVTEKTTQDRRKQSEDWYNKAKKIPGYCRDRLGVELPPDSADEYSKEFFKAVIEANDKQQSRPEKAEILIRTPDGHQSVSYDQLENYASRTVSEEDMPRDARQTKRKIDLLLRSGISENDPLVLQRKKELRRQLGQ